MKLLALIAYLMIGLYIGFYASDRLYFIGEQLMNVILMGLVVYLLPKSTAKALATGIFTMLFFEMVDEIAGRNTRYYFNDYISVLLALTITVYLSLKWNNLKKKS
jgi:hypothetical protein